jgi:hypothetical protein
VEQTVVHRKISKAPPVIWRQILRCHRKTAAAFPKYLPGEVVAIALVSNMAGRKHDTLGFEQAAPIKPKFRENPNDETIHRV